MEGNLMSLRLNRTVLSVVATLVAFAVVASGCGSDGAGDRHAFFDPEDSLLRLDADFGLGGALVADELSLNNGFVSDSQGNLYTAIYEYHPNSQVEVRKYGATGELFFRRQFKIDVLSPGADDWTWNVNLLVDANDRLVIKGFQGRSAGTYRHWIIRLNSDGSVDTEFSDNGLVAPFSIPNYCTGRFALSEDESLYHYIAKCNVGQIVGASGELVNHGYKTYLMNISTADGLVQGSGWVLLEGDPNTKLSPTNENQFVIATAEGEKVELRRYNSDGTLDRQFGFNGLQEHSPVAGAPRLTVRDIAIDEDGWIVVVGYTHGYDDDREEAFIAMYDANGQPYNDFGSDGFNSVVVADPVPLGSESSLLGVEWRAEHVAINGSNYAVSVTRERTLRLKDITEEVVSYLSTRTVCALTFEIFMELEHMADRMERHPEDAEMFGVDLDDIPVFDYQDPSLVDAEVDPRHPYRAQMEAMHDCMEAFARSDDPAVAEAIETAARKFLNEIVALNAPEPDSSPESESSSESDSLGRLGMLGEFVRLNDSQEVGIVTFTRNPDVIYGYEGIFPSERYPVVEANEGFQGGNRHDESYGLVVDASGGVFLGTRLPHDSEDGIVLLERGLPSTEVGTFASAPMCGETLENASFISWNIETNLPYGEFAYELETGAGIDFGFGLPRFHPSVEAVLNHTLGPIQEVPWSGSFRINGYDVRDVRDGWTDPVLIGSSEWFDPADPANGCALASIVVAESADASSVEENGGTDTFTVRLNSVIDAGVDVMVTSSSPDDLMVSPAQLQFSPGNEFEDQLVTVTGVDDAAQDGSAGRTILLNVAKSQSYGSYANAGEVSVSVMIIDDEQVLADEIAAVEAAAAEADAAAAQVAADAQAVADAAAAQAAAEQALADAAVVAQELADAAAAQAGIDQEAAVQAAVEQALAEVAAAEAAAAEAAAAEAAAAEAAAAEAAAAEAAAAEAAAGVVSTGYTAEDFASVASAAEFMELTISEFQATGVYVVDLLTQLGEGGYDSVSPLTDPPDVSGSESIAFTWDDEGQEVLDRVSTGYQVTPAEAQKFGAFLLTFFVGLTRG